MNSVLMGTGTGESKQEKMALTGAGSVAPSGVLVGVSPLGVDGEPQVALPEGTASLHVLVVDDDAAVRKACCVIAAGKGFAVGEAGSVAQAKAILKHRKIDLLLLDLKLPDGGGLALLEQVKALYPDTAVVVMTAFATVASAVEAMRIGAGDYLTKPFVPVDCGSLVPTLIESELFGHVKGAFTGADRAKEGLLATAEGGTVFLDEIGELPLDLQAKLLRALQEKEVRPVGSTQARPISARVLAATNRDLTAMVEQGRFRRDLYFRLNVVNLRIPPLRDRRGDIPLLAMHFLQRMQKESGVAYEFSDDTLRVMAEYDWPGNVRELENAIERACALSSGPVLHMGDLPTQLQDFRMQRAPMGYGSQSDAVAQAEGSGAGMSDGAIVSIAEMEKHAILGTIRQLKGDKLMAARLLGIGKTTLYRKLKEYGITDGLGD